MRILLLYLFAANLAGYLAMGADKKRARTLLLLAAAGGSVGVALGMTLFRHKTLHRKFTLGVPAIMLLQAALAVWAVWPK